MSKRASPKTRTKPDRPANAEGTRTALLAAAVQLLSADGYERTTIQQIAAAAGVTAPTLYAHFRSKDELVEALIENVLTEAGRLFEVRFPKGLTFEQKLELLLNHQFGWAEERSDLFAFLLRYAPPSGDPDALRRQRLASWDEWLREHAADEPWMEEPAAIPTFAAYMLDSVAHTAFQRWLDGGGTKDSLLGSAPHIVEMFVAGMHALAALER